LANTDFEENEGAVSYTNLKGPIIVHPKGVNGTVVVPMIVLLLILRCKKPIKIPKHENFGLVLFFNQAFKAPLACKGGAQQQLGMRHKVVTLE